MERDDGMLVSKRWLEYADDKLNKSDAPTPTKTNAPSSRFYDVRPCKLTSGWTSENGVGVATANLIINSQESDVSIKIYDATGDAAEKGVDSGAFCYAVYRGRWEVLASFASNGGGAPMISYVSRVSYSGDAPLYELTNGVVVYDPLAPESYPLASGDKVVYIPTSGVDYQGIVIQAEPLV